MRKRYWVGIATAFSFIILITGIVFLWFWMFGDTVFGNDYATIGESLGVSIGENGNWWIAGSDSGILARGDDGFTPYVGENGNWWIGTRDTFVSAIGKNGTDGVNGTNGTNGLTPYIHENGNWWIGDYDTGVKAEGAKGDQGDPGTPGTNGTNGLTPYIHENGNWWIGDYDTGVKAEGTKGDRGDLGTPGTNGNDGNGIIEAKISGGCLYVRYTSAPEEWINVGKITNDEISTLRFYPLPDGSYGVGAGDLLYSEELTIPAEHNGRPVSAIVPYGFSGALNLKRVTLPGTLKEIGESAFLGASRLSEIVIPKSVTYVGKNAFFGCSSLSIKLEAETLPDGWSAEFNPDGRELVLGYSSGSGVTSSGFRIEENSDGNIIITEYVGNAAFLEIPEYIDGKAVVSIGSGAFRSKTDLLCITLPKTLTEIKDGAFVECFKLLEIYNYSIVSVSAGSGVAEYALAVHTSDVKSILVEKDGFVFTNIGGASYLVSATNKSESLVLPEYYDGKEYKIYDYFAYSNGIVESITISRGVAEIGKYAFAKCPKIKNIIFDAERCESLLSDTNAFAYSCDNATLTVGKNAPVVPAYLFATEDAAASPKLLSVVFSEDSLCNVIGTSAFCNVASLKSLTLSQSVSLIEQKAFFETGLSEISGTSSGWNDGKNNYTADTLPEALKASNKEFNRTGG